MANDDSIFNDFRIETFSPGISAGAGHWFTLNSSGKKIENALH